MSFSRAKKAVFSRSRWQEQSDIIDGMKGISSGGAAHYQAFFEGENEDIDLDKTYLWDIKGE